MKKYRTPPASVLKRIILRTACIALLLPLITEPLQAQEQINTVSGNVQLQGQNDHSGITVAIFRGPLLDTVVSDTFGDFQLDSLTFGKYFFEFSKAGYINEEQHDITVSENMFLQDVILDTIPDTTYVSGHALLTGATTHTGIAVTVVSDLSGTQYDTTDITGRYSCSILSGAECAVSFTYSGFYADMLDSITVAGSLYTIDTTILDSAYLLQGTARYADKSTHTDIAFTATSPDSTVNINTTTDEDGLFNLTVPDSGQYLLTLSAPGYLLVDLGRTINAYRTDMGSTWLDTVPPGSTYYGGILERDTRWTDASVRFIKSDLTIPDSVTLIIEAGTRIYVATKDTVIEGEDEARVELRIQGTLDCRGTRQKQVVFQSEASSPAAGNWRGIEILNGADTCRITNTTIKHAYYGVQANAAAGLLLDSCRLTGNNSGIDITATPFLMDGTIIKSNAAAAGDIKDSRFAVTHCRFISNGTNGPGFHGGQGAVFNCLVYANRGTRGITITDSVDIVLCNNTIEDNGNYGIDANRARAVIINNVITNHQAFGINNSNQSYGADIEIAYNCMWFNGQNFHNCPDSLLGGRRIANANGDTCDGRYNLFVSPSLITVHEDRRLGTGSKCRYAGTDRFYSVQLDDTVKVYNKEDGLSHIGRDYDMASVVTYERGAAIRYPEAAVPIPALPCPVAGFSTLVKLLPPDTRIYSITGILQGTLTEMAARKRQEGMFVIAVPRNGSVLPVRILVQRR